jgi:hypothetical protein
MSDTDNNANENVTSEAKTPHDVPTVRVKTGDGDYKIVNRADYLRDPHAHGELIKGGEDQEQGIHAGASERNPSGTFSEPTPTDIRYPNKDATEFENNHGAFVRKSAAQMRDDLDMPDAPGGLFPDGAMRLEPTGPGTFRVMSGNREVLDRVAKGDADKFNAMSDEEKASWVEDRGGRAPEMKASKDRKADRQVPRSGTHPAAREGEPNGVRPAAAGSGNPNPAPRPMNPNGGVKR